MNDSDEQYKKDVLKFSLESLNDVFRNIDKEKYPQRFQIIKDEIDNRRQIGQSNYLKNTEAQEIKPEIKGIGGWLLLPLFGLAISPVLWAYVIYVSTKLLFNFQLASVVSDPKSRAYIPNWNMMISFNITSGAIFFIFSSYVLFLFIQNKKSTPKMMIILMIVGMAFCLITYMFYIDLPEIYEKVKNRVLLGLIQAIIGSLIWIPYFRLSKRVSNTFIHE